MLVCIAQHIPGLFIHRVCSNSRVFFLYFILFIIHVNVGLYDATTSSAMPTSRARLLTLLVHIVDVSAHGHLTFPPSTRHGGSLAEAGRCDSRACMWFSQPTSIQGPPTVNDSRYRTFNVDVSDGPTDWTRTMPWRAPGTAPVLGSGCGVSGGASVPLANGGKAAPSMPPQGSDGALLPRQPPAEWARGSIQEVAWAINANHVRRGASDSSVAP